MCCVLFTTVWWICAQLIAKSEEVMRLLPQGKVGLPGQREASTHYATRSLRGRKSNVTINCNQLQVISCHLMILEWQRRERMPGAGDQELECSPVVSTNYLWRTRTVKINIYQGWCRYELCGQVEFDLASSCSRSFSFSLPGNLLWHLLHYSQDRSNCCNLK